MSEVDLPSRLERYGSAWSFERIAVTAEDTARLPSFDARTKAGDVRYDWFTQRHGFEAWELDAIDPNDLRQRVREQIGTRLNLLAWTHAIEIEKAEVESMRGFAAAWRQSIYRGEP